jgi:anti-sigma factor (TIGR02949 family)
MTFIQRLKRLLGRSKESDRGAGGNGKGQGSPDVISCKEAMDRLQEYLDGELDLVSHEEVAHHFAICQKCYPHLRLEERFRELLHRAGGGQACPEHLRRQVLEVLSSEADEGA